jgi:hypothetical protein
VHKSKKQYKEDDAKFDLVVEAEEAKKVEPKAEE